MQNSKPTYQTKSGPPGSVVPLEITWMQNRHQEKKIIHGKSFYFQCPKRKYKTTTEYEHTPN